MYLQATYDVKTDIIFITTRQYREYFTDLERNFLATGSTVHVDTDGGVYRLVR